MQGTRSDIEHLVGYPTRNFSIAAAGPQDVGFLILEGASIRETSAAEFNVVSTRLSLNGSIILDAYVRVFDRLFVPYNGPDEPPTFEPEDYPVR
jgi:hypothetical protein